MIEDEAELVARLRRAYELFNRGEFDAAIEAARLDPAFEFLPTVSQEPMTSVGYRRWMEPDALDSMTIEPLEFRVVGSKLLVIARSKARGVGSGIELTNPSWAVWTVGDSGAILRLEGFVGDQEAEAFRAAGLDP